MIEVGIDPVAFLGVRWYGIFITLAIIWIILWAAWQIRQGAKISYNTLFTVALVGIPSGIRFPFRNWKDVTQQPYEVTARIPIKRRKVTRQKNARKRKQVGVMLTISTIRK